MMSILPACMSVHQKRSEYIDSARTERTIVSYHVEIKPGSSGVAARTLTTVASLQPQDFILLLLYF